MRTEGPGRAQRPARRGAEALSSRSGPPTAASLREREIGGTARIAIGRAARLRWAWRLDEAFRLAPAPAAVQHATPSPTDAPHGLRPAKLPPLEDGRRRQGPAAPRRHPPARPHPRRHRARAGGRGDLRARRADPPGLDPLPSPQRGRRAARARGDPRQPQRRPDARDRARLQLFLASRQHRRGPASHPPQPRACDRRLRPAPRLARFRLPAHARDGRRARAARRLLRSRAGEPGAHRPSDRSAAQEHADARARDRRTARRARPRCTATRRSSRSTRSG